MSEDVKVKLTREEILKVLEEVERSPRRTRSAKTRSSSGSEYPEWDEKKVKYAKKVIKTLDDEIRGAYENNKYASVDHVANVVLRNHIEEMFATKPPFGRYEVDEQVWKYLKERVEKVKTKE